MATARREVKLTLDLDEPIAAGDALQTQTGRTYLVTSAVAHAIGPHAGRRWRIRAVVCAGGAPGGARIVPFRWYRRDPKRRWSKRGLGPSV